MIPGTTYIRTWYVYQHFLFDFPFDEIYRRLLFHSYQIRMYNTCPCTINSTAVSLFVYSLVGGGTHDTYVPPVDACVWRQLHLLAVARCSNSYCIVVCIPRHSIIIAVSGYCFFPFFVRAFCMRLLNSIHDEIGNRSFACWFASIFSLEIAVQTNRPKSMYKGDRRKEVYCSFGSQKDMRIAS